MLISRGLLFTGSLFLALVSHAVAFDEMTPSPALNMGCKQHKSHHHHSKKSKKCEKTVITTTFQTWNNLTVTGSGGDLFQQVANITQGTKIVLPPIRFSSNTTQIVFPDPTIMLDACEGDTIFISAVITLDPNSSIISTQPLIIQSSDSKNIIDPANVVLIGANMLENNPTTSELSYNNNSFRTIFSAL